eukprot:CAMPEP_0115603318 /NCGR_PEP_ID=MMETSP0272-20121206/16364_1 /TAXON_ID=71861 /ORGANISM="Scrippsiella trochoidea, Strain CCMP3099" /LENGTH=130 /DNA_ID=CAMNT_0003038833 /DNA_START=45 /DNA_END=437 /DNA_ORIENTATION=+
MLGAYGRELVLRRRCAETVDFDYVESEPSVVSHMLDIALVLEPDMCDSGTTGSQINSFKLTGAWDQVDCNEHSDCSEGLDGLNETNQQVTEHAVLVYQASLEEDFKDAGTKGNHAADHAQPDTKAQLIAL